MKDELKTKKYCAGWQTHGSTKCGHYFLEGEMRSLCRREMRSTGDVQSDCTIKCTICLNRAKQPTNLNLFA